MFKFLWKVLKGHLKLYSSTRKTFGSKTASVKNYAVQGPEAIIKSFIFQCDPLEVNNSICITLLSPLGHTPKHTFFQYCDMPKTHNWKSMIVANNKPQYCTNITVPNRRLKNEHMRKHFIAKNCPQDIEGSKKWNCPGFFIMQPCHSAKSSTAAETKLKRCQSCPSVP